jgi:hypothetical protein
VAAPAFIRIRDHPVSGIGSSVKLSRNRVQVAGVLRLSLNQTDGTSSMISTQSE